MNKLEIKYIQKYNAVNNSHFYNLSYGGENFFEGRPHSDFSKTLIREHSPNLGRKLTDAEKKRIGDFHRGKVYNEETRKKISLNNGMRGRKMTDEMRKILIKSGCEHPRYGTHHTQESILKISEHRKGKTTGSNNPASRAVVRLTLDDKFVKQYSYMRLVKQDGFDPSSVGSCCREEYKQHLGYKFMYLEDYKHKVEVNPNE